MRLRRSGSCAALACHAHVTARKRCARRHGVYRRLSSTPRLASTGLQARVSTAAGQSKVVQSAAGRQGCTPDGRRPSSAPCWPTLVAGHLTASCTTARTCGAPTAGSSVPLLRLQHTMGAMCHKKQRTRIPCADHGAEPPTRTLAWHLRTGRGQSRRAGTARLIRIPYSAHHSTATPAPKAHRATAAL